MKQQMIPMPAESSVSAAPSGLKNNPTVRHNMNGLLVSELLLEGMERNKTKSGNPWLAPVWRAEGGGPRRQMRPGGHCRAASPVLRRG